MKSYDFNDRNSISKIATNKVNDYLISLEETLGVINVEEDRAFQEFDIDLVHVTDNDVVNVEVKLDTYESGNFFFETISNTSKGTKGCFMYTTADYIYYCFIKRNLAYVLPMPDTRNWFMENMDRFEQKKLATKKGSVIQYYSHGYPVPIKVVMEEVNGVKVVKI